MKPNKKFIAIIIALLVVAGVATYISQQEEPAVPTVAPVEAPVEQPMETPTETPVEGDTAVEGQPAADETTATGNLGGSAGENNFGMTNLMDSIKDNNQTDVEHSLDLEEQKQETPVGSDVSSDNGTGSDAQTGVPSGNGGSGTGTGNSNSSDTQPPSNPQPTSDPIPEGQQSGLPSDAVDAGRYNTKEEATTDETVSNVGDWNAKIGAWECVSKQGVHGFLYPNGGWLDYSIAQTLGLV